MNKDRARPDVLIRPDGRVEPYRRPDAAEAGAPPGAGDTTGWVLRRVATADANAGAGRQFRYDGRRRPWRPERLDRGGLVDRVE